MLTKVKKLKFSVKLVSALSALIILSLLIGLAIGSTSIPNTAIEPTVSQPYVLESPFSNFDWFIGKYSNNSYYPVNCSNWNTVNAWISTNLSDVLYNVQYDLDGSTPTVIRFQSGTTFSVTASIIQKPYVTFDCNGARFELDANCYMITTLNQFNSRMRITGGIFDANNRTYSLIKWVGATYSSVDHCTFFDCMDSFVVFNAATVDSNYYNHFDKNMITCTTAQGLNPNYGFVSGKDGYIEGNTIDCQYGGDGKLQNGIILNGSSNCVSGNHITFNTQSSIYVFSGGNKLTGNCFDCPYESAIRTATCDKLTITGNEFLGAGWNGGTGIDFNGQFTNAAITGNFWSTYAGGDYSTAIALNSNAAGCNIYGRGNVIINGTDAGVWKNPGVTGTLTVLDAASQDFNYIKAP